MFSHMYISVYIALHEILDQHVIFHLHNICGMCIPLEKALQQTKF